MKSKIVLISSAVLIVSFFAFKFIRGGDFYYAATIESDEVDISSRVSAVIEKYFAGEGDKISKDALLVKLDCPDLKLSAQEARRDYLRARSLKDSGSITNEAFDKFKYKYDDALMRLGWCEIKSPLEGKILYTYHESGELVGPGVKLATISDLNNVYGYIYVEQAMLAKLSVGMSVKGYLPETGMSEFSGAIVKINDEAEFTPKNVQTRSERTSLVFGVKIAFQNPGQTLKPGMTVEVKLP